MGASERTDTSNASPFPVLAGFQIGPRRQGFASPRCARPGRLRVDLKRSTDRRERGSPERAPWRPSSAAGRSPLPAAKIPEELKRRRQERQEKAGMVVSGEGSGIEQRRDRPSSRRLRVRTRPLVLLCYKHDSIKMCRTRLRRQAHNKNVLGLIWTAWREPPDMPTASSR